MTEIRTTATANAIRLSSSRCSFAFLKLMSHRVLLPWLLQPLPIMSILQLTYIDYHERQHKSSVRLLFSLLRDVGVWGLGAACQVAEKCDKCCEPGSRVLLFRQCFQLRTFLASLSLLLL